LYSLDIIWKIIQDANFYKTPDWLPLASTAISPLSAEPERVKELFIHHVFFYLKEPNNAQHEAKLLEGLHKLG
jgi:hypothetical protein